MRHLGGIFRENSVGAGVRLGEAERLNVAGEHDDGDVGMDTADPPDKFHSVHSRHAMVGDHQIELRLRKMLQGVFAAGNCGDAVAQLFEDCLPRTQATLVIVDKEDVRGTVTVKTAQSAHLNSAKLTEPYRTCQSFSKDLQKREI